MRWNQLFCTGGVLLIGLLPVQARLVFISSPESLDAKSSLVCNARVESISERGWIMRMLRGGDKIMEARLKVLHVFKGTAPGEITYYYHALGSVDYAEPPDYPGLKAGSRYRFFLQKGDSYGRCTDVMWATADESQGVEPLSMGEPDDSAYLTRGEALRLAVAYVGQNRPDERVAPAGARIMVIPIWGGPSGFSTKMGTVYSLDCTRTRSSNAPGRRIFVWGDRTVDAELSK